MSNFVTEDNIKKAALHFLKLHYRYQERKDDAPVIGKLDMLTPSGIIADGLYTYTLPDGQPFLATFEATSYATRDEVKYRKPWSIMFWDALAIGSVAVAMIISYGFAFHYFSAAEWGLWKGIIGILGGITLIGGSVIFLTYNRHRYRYIYAVEQFKRYHANEQWIAIGSDIFNHSSDKYLRELREQCIINGFGLVSIQPDLEAQLMITPSRINLFKGTREVVDFLSETEFANRLRGNRITQTFAKAGGKLPPISQIGARISAMWRMFQESRQMEKFQKRLPTIKALRGANVILNRAKFVEGLQRYRRGFWQQVALVVIGLGVTGVIFYNELIEAGIITINEIRYMDEEELATIKVSNRPEPTDYVIDTPYVAPFGDGGLTYLDEHKMSDPMVPSSVEQEEKPKPIIEQLKPSIEEPIPDVKPPVIMRPKPISRDTLSKYGVGIYVKDIEGNFVEYDCTRFFNFTGTQYFVQEGIYATREQAIERIEDFTENDMEANYLWLGCFSETAVGYAVFFEYLLEDVDEAQTLAANYRGLIRKNLEEDVKVMVQSVKR